MSFKIPTIEIVEIGKRQFNAHKIKSLLRQQKHRLLREAFCLSVDEAIFIGKIGYAGQPPLGYIAISPAILWCGVGVDLCTFFCDVLNYFNITPMQLVLNS